jgi:uncharacterized membrane protein (UPF0127 family)
MNKLNTPFPNETTIIIRYTKKTTKIRTELASSDIEIYQALNYRKKKEFTKPLTLKFNNPLLQSFVKFNFLFPVELIAIDYKTHQVKKIQIIEVKKHTGDFIQGFSEYSIAILAPRGFSSKYKIEENSTMINLKANNSLKS